MCEKWKDEYKINILSGNLDTATEIKNNNINRNLYHYSYFDDNGYWKDWINGAIVANLPYFFNDPFDCEINITQETMKKIIEHNLIDVIKKQTNRELNIIDTYSIWSSLSSGSLDKLVETVCQVSKYYGKMSNPSELKEVLEPFMGKRSDSFFKKVLRVSCFSETKDSILMWSHYAMHHAGFCIEYDFSSHKDILDLLFPIIYDIRKYKLLPQSLEKYDWLHPVVLCKAPCWSYEKEWRYVNAIDRDSPGWKKPFEPDESDLDKSDVLKIMVPHAIKSIYIGINAIRYHDSSVNEMKHMAKELNIDVFEIQFDDDEYKLIANVINTRQ